MNLIIIDDEDLVLEGLKLLISRYDPDIQTHCFNDVDLALSYVKDNEVDIIISDIQMPKLDGLELCNRIKQLCDAEIIIISGYEDFNYAKKAVELGAIRYILKPINQNELINVLEKAITRIKKNQSINNYHIQKSSMIISKLLSDIANGFKNIDLIKDDWREASENLDYTHFTVSFVILDDSYFIPSFQNNSDFCLMYKQLYKKINSIIKDNDFAVFFSEPQPGRFIFLCMEDFDNSYKFISLITKSLKCSLHIGSTAGISNAHTDINELLDAYNEAMLSLRREFFEGKKSIYTYNKELIQSMFPNSDNKQNAYHLTKLNFYQSLISSHIIDKDNTRQFQNDTDTLFIDIKTFCFSYNDTYRFCEELLLLIIFNLFKSLEHSTISMNDIIKFCGKIQLKKQKTLADLRNSFLKTLNELTEIVYSKISYKSNMILLKVNELLANDCSLVTLQTAADSIGLNPTYFSILFKEKAGVNFKDYITEYKINKAKEMLLDPKIKIYEICNKIGYLDSNYFSKVFKKITGFVPTEYRTKFIQNG